MEDNSTRHWQLKIDDDRVAWLRLDKAGSGTNTLSRAVMQDLDACLAEIERASPRAVVVTSAKPSGFIAGADIKEFTALEDSGEAHALVRGGQAILDRLERLPCPTVAAINGFALGGGLELALACRYRIAADDPAVKLGLPEVMLGIHPGFGGTVRSVRLIGVPAAMELMLTGRSIGAAKARSLGVVDRLAPATELEAAAKRLAMEAPSLHTPSPMLRLMNFAPLRPFIAARMKKQVARRAKLEHYPAPYAIVDLWRRHGASRTTGYEAEARSIAELICSPTSRNLVRVFLLQDRLKSLGTREGLSAERVHIIGAGVMGGDIAAWCAHRGLDVSLQDRSPQLIEPALARARSYFEKRLKDPGKRQQAIERLVGDVEGARIRNADVVIEAIFENVEAKRELYAWLEPQMKAGAVLATNTSSIMLEALARDLADPGRLVGLHFFNPVDRMPLVEVIFADGTRSDALNAALTFTRRIDKLPLPCRSAPGFVVNRILMPYLTEAMFAARDGIPLPVIDRAATDFGMPMGPVELADTVGLDVALHVGRILAEAFGKPPPDAVAELVAEKKLGRKTGEGLYVWRDGKPVKPQSEARPVPEDLEDRLILPMLNEAVAVLREGVVEDADLLDAGVIFGTGFAPFRGGPLHHARALGIEHVVARLEVLTQRYGKRFQPDPGWLQLAKA